MILHTLWVHDGDDDAWMLEAWDEYTIDGNPEGWAEALAKAEKSYKACRVVRVNVPNLDVIVRKAFRPADVEGETME